MSKRIHGLVKSILALKTNVDYTRTGCFVELEKCCCLEREGRITKYRREGNIDDE